MAIFNLAEKNSTQLDKRFSQNSITEKWVSNQYDFDGVNAIKIWTLGEAVINDYTLNPEPGVSRFGQLREVEDEINTYQLRRKRAFNQSFDETNVQDQMFVKKAQAYLKQVWDEQLVPEIDSYRLKTWADGAGQGLINTSGLTNNTIIRAMLVANAALDNKRVPRKNRVFFVPTTVAIETKLSDELKYNPAFTSNAVINGLVNIIDGTPVVTGPDDLFPAGVNFVLKYKNATVDPMKLRLLRVITNSENVAGSIMQGLIRYDSFVLAQKADGIYVHAKDGMVAAPTVTVSSGQATITTTTSGATIKYTIDGTNPKTSATAEVYTDPVDISTAKMVRAYAYKDGMLSSPITNLKLS